MLFFCTVKCLSVWALYKENDKSCSCEVKFKIRYNLYYLLYFLISCSLPLSKYLLVLQVGKVEKILNKFILVLASIIIKIVVDLIVYLK